MAKQLRVNTRSEWVNVATDAMWDAMRNAVIGWPHFGEDDNVNRLEAMVADLTGKESSMFVPTTNCANLLAMMGLCSSGDQVIMESRCHLWWVEQNIPRLTGASPRLVEGNKLGEMDSAEVEAAILEQRYGMKPRTAAVCLENSHNVCGGVALHRATFRSRPRLRISTTPNSLLTERDYSMPPRPTMSR